MVVRHPQASDVDRTGTLEFHMNLGSAISLCRTRRGYSQSSLAESSGCPEAYVSLLESGLKDPDLPTVKKIATALSVPAEILLFLANSEGFNEEMKERSGQLARTALEHLTSIDPEQNPA